MTRSGPGDEADGRIGRAGREEALAERLDAIADELSDLALEELRTAVERGEPARPVDEKRLSQEIPKFFNELKTAAKPNVLLKGPPSVAEFEEGVKKIVEQSGVNPAGGVPMVPVVPKP